MTLAFFGAYRARFGACLKCVAYHRLVAACAARCDCRGRKAEVGAIEIQADALSEIGNCLFSQTGIGTDRTGLGAVIAKVDAVDQSLIDVALNVRMARNHLLGMHAGLLC